MKDTACYRFVRPLLGLALFTFGACNSGGGGGEVVLQGKLMQGGVAAHSDAKQQMIPKHGAGVPLDEVQVCALGVCSTTDSEGQWGFAVGKDGARGEVLFTFSGHIKGTSVVSFPESFSEAEITFVNMGNGMVEAEETVFDAAQ